MPRLFFAVQTPEPLRASLRVAQQIIVKEFDRDALRLEHLENSHVTLAFLGEIPERSKQPLIDAAQAEFSRSAVHPFEIRLGETSVNDARRPSVIWANVLPIEPLAELHRIASRIASTIDIVLEARRYIPHLTLARIRRPVRICDITLPPLGPASSTITEVVLVESVLGYGPPKHTVIARFAL